MKRISSLLLALCLVLGGVGAAKADGIDIKVQGIWDFAFGWTDNGTFKDSAHGQRNERDNDKTIARQRLRTQINFIAGEHLQGVAYFEIGNLNWGRGGSVGRGSGGGLDADGVNVETRRLYVDWLIPNTPVMVRMGMQSLTLPNVMGSPVFDAEVGAILISSPITENVSIAAFWMRPFDPYENDSDSGWATRSLDDEVDAFGLLLPIKGPGFNVTPWGIFGRVGNASGLYGYLFGDDFSSSPIGSNYDDSTVSIWWAGLNFELTVFDPLTFKLDGMYGRLNRNNMDGLGASSSDPGGWSGLDVGTKGWFMAAALDYAFDWGTPGIFGWYSTGDDFDDFVDDGWLGRIPVLGVDQGFQPTTFGMAGTYSIGTDSVISATGVGTWGIGIQVADVSFIPDLKHTLRVAYYRGTNDEDMAMVADTVMYSCDGFYLTKEDSVWEVNFDHQYKIYENLTAVLELGYLHLKADRDTWGSGDESENAWKAQLMFRYAF